MIWFDKGYFGDPSSNQWERVHESHFQCIKSCDRSRKYLPVCRKKVNSYRYFIPLKYCTNNFRASRFILSPFHFREPLIFMCNLPRDLIFVQPKCAKIKFQENTFIIQTMDLVFLSFDDVIPHNYLLTKFGENNLIGNSDKRDYVSD